ncbi:VOC family protein [Actinoplanes sp. N902-109]|uniref:VOC family protein n=1 Tax=Actinoplanes sp. (strain N902-109) TaxID=649831 RepID=UPI0005A1997C|nr:VOC family protein [Actinoplanes sp. N902-109]
MIRWVHAFIDRPAAELEVAVDFWAAVTGTRPQAQADPPVHRLVPGDADDWIGVQGVDSGPGGAHLDFSVDDVAAWSQRALTLGASTVAGHGGWRVLRSPAGLPFCVWPRGGESRLPGVDSGTRSRLDQVCLDIAGDGYPAEVRFWAGLTGWELQTMPDFHRLKRPAGIAVQILLQRVGDAPSRAHLDIACADADAERQRHEALGATLVQEFPDWLVMRDPAAGTYCLTRRDPRG